MGGKLSGNHTVSSNKLPKDLKSQLYQFRLDPKNPDHKPLKDALDGYIGKGNRSEAVRDLVAIALAVEGVKDYQQRVVSVSAEDVVTIKDIVTYIMDRIEQGIVSAGPSKPKKRKASDIELPAAVQHTLDHYIGGGLLENSDEQEDPFG